MSTSPEKFLRQTQEADHLPSVARYPNPTIPTFVFSDFSKTTLTGALLAHDDPSGWGGAYKR